jgi:general secretion pathway protein L
MSTLIIYLPLSAGDDATRYEHVLTPDGQTVAANATASAGLLPEAGRGTDEIVAVVPAEAASWHRVELPKGVGAGSPRLRAVLQSLLEDRLLDDPEELHLAIEPRAAAGQPAWVTVCNKIWLRQHLQVLEAAGRPVTRIVPEFAPHTDPLRLQILDEAGLPQMVISGQGVTGGVVRLPLTAGALAFALGREDLPDQTEVLAEPAVAAKAEALLQYKAELQQRPLRLVRAAQTSWDMAQFELASTGRSRTLKRLFATAQEFRHAPQWRAARWGVGLLLVANLVGLNAWAWKEQSAWQSKRSAIQSTLTQTFPAVKVVVDAPVQMAREVAALRQATGAPSSRDLEAMLGAMGSVLPAGKAATAIDFTAGEARLKGLNLGADESASIIAKLKSLGYATRTEGDSLLIKPESAP